MRQTTKCVMAAFICAAFACVIWPSNHPEAKAQTKQSDKQGEVTRRLDEINATLKEANEPDGTTKPCKPDEENRNSDLCAQWKAADAARNGAEASWIQVWVALGGLAVGLVTMASAIAAARYAKRAAEATRESVEVAQSSAKISSYKTRPWIKLTATNANIKILEYGRESTISVTVECENVGDTPALNFSIRPRVIGLLRMPRILHETMSHIVPDEKLRGDSLFPGEKRSRTIDVTIPAALVAPDTIKEIGLLLVACYKIYGDDEVRMSPRLYRAEFSDIKPPRNGSGISSVTEVMAVGLIHKTNEGLDPT